ncbi:MAG: hypothetical protein DWQ47_03215 [Acidobacteria bacterium]|nr:MAG: hypothetical protein DWQ32_06765 [Acidobacteriota bacterium]REK01413.1 MAG: hypothetical protein DWQ38_03200 [Acidobacteriota bacterium]REK14369.1 MAG: hypothetical protein DWQ43_12455 [Acidobacteriota bacterium]REK45084.1 MAG: hypothetical protein DWQ47_03215 [Acidobacteriota bacterium]
MKKQVLGTFLILILSVFLVMGSFDGVSGSWKVSGNVSGNAINQDCIIEQKEDKISGTCKWDGQPDAKITGTVNDKKVVWKFDMTYNGSPITLVFEGTMDDAISNIEGKVKVDPYGIEGEFTAKKEAGKDATEK